MRINDEDGQAARLVQEDRIRRIVREEIIAALQVLSRSAHGLDMPYETAELDSRALENITAAAENAVQRLTCEHEFRDYQPEKCWNCREPAPEPVNPFEVKPLDPGCEHAFVTEGTTTTCQICEGVKTDGTS